MLRRSVLVAVVAFTAVLFSTATPVGAAVRPFNPPQTVVGGCGSFTADSVVTSSGALVGFATCPGPSGLPIRFFSRNANGTVNPSQATGFFGSVLGVTYDTTATYVLYFNDSQIRIGKRTNTGVFSSRAVDTWGGVATVTGDVIARDGQWFGVWSKQVGPGGEFAQTELFSSGTGLGISQVTTTALTIDDGSPTLAYSGTIPVAIWSRTTFPEMSGPSDLIVKKYIGGTWQGERVFASLGTHNLSPDMYITAGRTFVTWERDGFIVVASNATGSFTSHRFNTGGYGPKVAASTTSGVIDHVFVTWTTFAGGVFFAESASTGSVLGIWDGTFIAPAGTFAFGVGGFATKAIVTYGTGSSVAVRAQT
ncbi:MAG TPA: hypothetical protein VK360_01745 [Acidimicrobiales bacterium]|nr:hypothetical protein [Acidimicrobiales bacterium]